MLRMALMIGMNLGLGIFQVPGEKEEGLKKRQIIQPSIAGEAEAGAQHQDEDKQHNGVSNRGFAMEDLTGKEKIK